MIPSITESTPAPSPATARPALSAEAIRHLPAVSALVHFSSCTRILDKRKALIVPRANVFQRRMAEAYEVLMAVGVPVRILGLKMRQCGGTTIACHLAYHHCQRFNTDAVIIANVNANSQEILGKIKRYAAEDRFPWGNPLEARETRLAWANGSRAEITSAETLNAGISRTRQFVLFSEACKYPRGGVKDDKKIMASVLPSVPDAAGTCVIAESTPEGASGWFYEQWHGTKDMPPALSLADYMEGLKRGEPSPGNGWVKVFAAWHEIAENQRAVTEAERRRLEATLTAREQRGVQDHGWSPEQLAWRRDTIASECGGSAEAFDEYYPEDDVTCFLASGRPRFNMKAVTLLEKAMHARPCEEGTLDVQENGGVIFSPCGGGNGHGSASGSDNRGGIHHGDGDGDGDGDGGGRAAESATGGRDDTLGYAPFQIWERPRYGCRYLLWCDPATGADQTESRNPDRHSIGVLRAAYAEAGGVERKAAVVARVRPPFDDAGPEVARRIIALSKYYGGCLVVLEINMGLHILALLRDAGIPLYRREVIDPHDQSERKLMYGWKLKDRDQRRTVIDCLALAIQDQQLDIWCPHILNEFKTFTINRHGKEIARSGCHDDDVLGLAMAKYCEGSASLYVEPVRRRRKPADWHLWKR